MTCERAISSVGQSYRLITGWSGVRVPDGPPTSKLSEHFKTVFGKGFIAIIIGRG